MTVELIIFKNEVLHTIEQDVHLVERARKLEEPILTENSSDRYMLLQQIDLAVSMAVARMQAYIVMPSQFAQRIAHNHTEDWQEKNIFLDMPHDWPPYCVDSLKNTVHRFITKTALHNFLRVVLPQDPYVALSLDESQAAYNEINAIINTRLGPTKIHPTPFG